MSRMTRLLMLSLLATGCGNSDKERNRAETANVLERMGGFRDDMCKCQEKTCADDVQASMTKWSTDEAVKAQGRDRPNNMDEASMKKLTEIGQAYGECMTRAMSASVPPADAGTNPPPPPPPDESQAPLPPKAPLVADVLLRQVREWAQRQRPGRFVESAAFSYVDAEGLLDPTDGEVRIVFGRVNDSNANRRVGGRVRPKQQHKDCFTLQTTGGKWLVSTNECGDTVEYIPRCSVSDIWKRAIAKKAPADAVALVTFRASEKKWDFAIDDEPLKVHVHESFADDCELNVEK